MHSYCLPVPSGGNVGKIKNSQKRLDKGRSKKKLILNHSENITKIKVNKVWKGEIPSSLAD